MSYGTRPRRRTGGAETLDPLCVETARSLLSGRKLLEVLMHVAQVFGNLFDRNQQRQIDSLGIDFVVLVHDAAS